ncbi:hypothetical protein RRF57_010981 [Xylaria bambusicola]|uniref:Uncharacterized protein n=1 Tax=Xylaria bambusicola TaxID=326684 RepID=A0AAN7V445_9PEZI
MMIMIFGGLGWKVEGVGERLAKRIYEYCTVRAPDGVRWLDRLRLAASGPHHQSMLPKTDKQKRRIGQCQQSRRRCNVTSPLAGQPELGPSSPRAHPPSSFCCRVLPITELAELAELSLQPRFYSPVSAIGDWAIEAPLQIR